MTDHPPISVDRWGKDHWSLLAYVESRTVEHDGYLNPRHVRTDGDRYPTRLYGGEQVPGHSDMDVVADLAAAGLVEYGRASRTVRDRIDLTYRCSLTAAGRAYAHALRSHKADGGNFAEFRDSAHYPGDVLVDAPQIV